MKRKKGNKKIQRTSDNLPKVNEGRKETVYPGSRYAPLSALLVLAFEGNTYEEIGKKFGITKQAVSKRLKPLRKHIEGYLTFKNHEDTVIEELQHRLISGVDGEDIKKMIRSRGMTDFGILEDKKRMVRGQSGLPEGIHPINIAQYRNEIHIHNVNAPIEDKTQATNVIEIPSTEPSSEK
jgi:predicted transcriptional regulator